MHELRSNFWLFHEVVKAVKQYIKYAFGILALLVVSCDSSENTVSPDDEPSDYVPLQKGLYHIYDVSDIRYELNVPQTLLYQLKTVVIDSFINASGDISYVIYRSKNSDNESDWSYIDTWSVTPSTREVIVDESNISYLKLKGPVVEGLEWNGNAYNNLESDTYVTKEIGGTFAATNKTFEDCVTVEQSNNDDFIVFLDQRKEVFSKSVGLVYKETTQLHYCTQTDQGCLGQQLVETGTIYKQTLTDYGVE